MLPWTTLRRVLFVTRLRFRRAEVPRLWLRGISWRAFREKEQSTDSKKQRGGVVVVGGSGGARVGKLAENPLSGRNNKV